MADAATTGTSDRRARMVDTQLATHGIRDGRVLEAMRKVPREAFLDPGQAALAYEDRPLPIGEGQTISQPCIVALMIEAAGLRPGDHALEIGTGSGYAAAVMARIAGRVISIERRAALADTARARLEAAGYGTVAVHVGDGTLGWAKDAPYDAILVAAGGPSVPQALKEQLAPGGRLVIPVGETEAAQGQSLLRVIRTGPDTWTQERICGVRFVPLIGAQGWTAKGRRAESAQGPGRSLPEMIADAAEPLPGFEDPAFGRLFDRWADRRVILLGEASHGTSEFYRARAAITRHLIAHRGYGIVAVEADWPDAAAVNRFVGRRARREFETPAFTRFPTWMWRNTVVEGFADWMRGHNDGAAPDRRAGFYGLDIYNMRDSIAAVLAYLDEHDPEAARIARERYGCLTPWQSDPATYGRAVLSRGYETCEQKVSAQLRDLLEKHLEREAEDGSGFLDAAQNARLIRSAERYYRIMYHGGAESWNLRDSHMFETLEHLLDARGPEAKAVVWAHNSHIGDARATRMGRVQGEHSIGQLCRERFGGDVALIGMGTHAGTVAAATDWGGEMEVKIVRPSLKDSFERLCHEAGQPRFLLDLAASGPLGERLAEERLQRFIGVIYRPETELRSHYAETALALQYDGWLWFDETKAVTPLRPRRLRPDPPGTWPFGP